MLDSYTQIGRDPNATTIRASFAATQGWEEQYRLLIQLGKQLPPLPVEWQTEDHRLHGCESHTWLLAEERGGLWHFACDSDARIVRGLIVIVLAALNRQSSAAIRSFDMAGYLAALGLDKHLSPSRSNGLNAIIQAIRERVA